MGDNLMYFNNMLTILGIPSVFAVSVWCAKMCIKFTRTLNILMAAQKAQMRSQLLYQFHQYDDAGFVSEDNLEDWINQYKAYHALVGDNQVLEVRKDALLRMPSTPSDGN